MDENIAEIKILAKTMEMPEDIARFEELLFGLSKRKDEKVLADLFGVFENACPFFEVMFGVIHLAETWPLEVYVKTFLKTLHENIDRAGFWMDCIANRIFNDKDYFSCFHTHMRLASRESLFKLFVIMEEASPHHQEVIGKLRKELQAA